MAVDHSKEMSLELPLRGGSSSSDAECSSSRTEPQEPFCSVQRVKILVVDLLASVAFWYFMFFVNIPEAWMGWTLFGVIVAAMLAWRLVRAFLMPRETIEDVPYTCGYVRQGSKEMFLVATVHISPRAPVDVEKVIDVTRPDVTMIELDDERLDRMRDPPQEVPQEPPKPKPEDLQLITVRRPNQEPMEFRAQRALWNGEWADEVLRGGVVFDQDNAYGISPSPGDRFEGSFALVNRGAPNGEFAAFALKAHYAHQSGAEALLVINNSNRLPMNRIGGGDSIKGDLKVFQKTWSCGFPPLPVLLLEKEDGEKLRAICDEEQTSGVSRAACADLEIKVMTDSYPRRTLRKRLCQAAALMFSGIGILYGIIQCFAVEVGGEFLAAEIASTERGIPCTCIDVDLNKFWSRIGWSILPTPCNIVNSAWCWLAFPRVAFNFLFPPRGNVDVFGSMFLHGFSFPLKTWAAFIIAGFCASKVTSFLLSMLGLAGATAAEQSGAVEVKNDEDRDVLQAYVMLIIEMYLMPQIYDSIANSRDEAMYRSIVSKGRDLNANRMVVVVGAGHSNGIIARARTLGL